MLIKTVHEVTVICTTRVTICIATKGERQGKFHRSADVDFPAPCAISRIC